MKNRQRKSPAKAHRFLIGAALVAVMLSAAGQSAALSDHEREGFTLGFSLGYGPGSVDMFPVDGEPTVQSGTESGSTPQIRLGYALIKHHLVLTVENRQWMIEQGILAEDKLRINTQCWTLGLSWFPGNHETAAGGFYIQAAGGVSNSRLTLLEPLEDDPWGNIFEEIFVQDESGSAFCLGLGYEFRVLPTVATGLAVGYTHIAVDSEIFDSAESWPISLTLNWYW